MIKEQSPFPRLEAWLELCERRLSIGGTGLLLAVAAFLVAVFTCFPFDPADQIYVEWLLDKVAHPFAKGFMGNRFLTPLVAHLLGGGKEVLRAVNYGFLVLMLATLYAGARAWDLPALLAAACVAALASTYAVLGFVWWPYFIEPASSFLLAAAFFLARRPAVSWLVAAVAVTNHENVVFMLPAIAAAQVAAGRVPAWRALAGLVLVAAFAVAWTKLWAVGDSISEANQASFLAAPLTNLRLAEQFYYEGLFFAFKLAWLLPVLAVWLALRQRAWGAVAWVSLPLLGGLAETVLATDTTRFQSNGFLGIVAAILVLAGHYGARRTAAAVLMLATVNLFVPQLTVFSPGLYTTYTAPHTLVRWLSERAKAGDRR